MRAALIIWCVLLGWTGSAAAQSGSTPPPPLAPPEAPFAAIDRHALSAPPQVEVSLDDLAAYLVKPAENDAEKARAIFRWITDRIAFDMEAYVTEHHGHLKPELVLRNRRALCQGFSALLEALAQRAGLQAVTIVGYAKGIGFFDGAVDPPEARLKPNHTWNAVRVEGSWKLVDATRGCGFIKAHRFRKVFQEQYFFTPPGHLVRTHFPSDPAWQLMPAPLSLQQFDTLPYIDAGYLRMGMKTQAIWQNPVFDGRLELYAKHGWLKVLAAPAPTEPLPPGRDYYFLVDAPHALEVAITQDKEAFALRRTGTRFEGAVRPRPGDMKLAMRRHPQGQLEPVLEYQIASWPGQRPPPAPPPPQRPLLDLLRLGNR